MTTSNELLQAALYYAEQGKPVFPLHSTDLDGRCSCRKADCGSHAKHPRTPKGFKDATTDPKQIQQWWTKNPDANIGIPTGPRSGWVVIDSDVKNGVDGLDSIYDEGLDMPETQVVGTPSGGHHHLYQYPEGEHIGNSTGILPGVDIRGEGGYVVAPPSVINGKPYTFTKQAGIAPLPSQWASRLTKRRQSATHAAGETILDGMRDNTLASLGGFMRDKGFEPDAIEAALRVTNTQQCYPPKSEKAVSRIARSVSRYEPGDYRAFVDLSKFRPPPIKADGNSSHVSLPRVKIIDLTPDVVLTPLEEIVPKLLPVGVPTLLAAHGGAGKSMLGLQLAVCVVAGREFMGFPTMRVPVTVFSAEDSTLDLRHRLQRIFTHCGVDPVTVADLLDIRDVTDINSALYVEHSVNGVRSGATTHVYNALLDACKQNNSRLLIIDNASDVFEAHENDRAHVRGFMRSLGQLAREINGAVLLLAHVNKNTAMSGSRSESYSGSTAWHNSARSRLALTETDGGLTLSHEKSNRGERCPDIPLSWSNEGLLVLGHVQFDGVRDGPDLEQLLDMITERTERGAPLSTSTTSGNAHFILSPLDGFPAGMDAKRFWRLIDRAERDGRLRRTMHKTEQRKSREVFEVVK